jgi:Fic/DOC family
LRLAPARPRPWSKTFCVADWDEDSPRLRQNLAQVLRDVRDSALRRDTPRVDAARQWQVDTLAGLQVPKAAYVGRFRGEPGIRNVHVAIGSAHGVPPAEVAEQLRRFEQRLQRATAALDERYPADAALDTDGLAAVIDLCAWAHAEWVRIHPFANGNGRTARLWANFFLMRYGLPPVVRLRPRPDGGYGAASARAMAGDWQPTASVIRQWLIDLRPASASPGPRRR